MHMLNILQKLPSWLTRKWSSYAEKKEREGTTLDMDDFLQWMDEKLSVREADEILHGTTNKKKKQDAPPTASALATKATTPQGGHGGAGGGQPQGGQPQGGQKQGGQQHDAPKQGGQQSKKYPCVKCGADHPLRNCPTFLNMTVEQRYATTKELNLCGKCLIPRHVAKNCRSKFNCATCKSSRHHTLLHKEGFVRGPPQPGTQPAPEPGSGPAPGQAPSTQSK
jgi:hypothetical protein